MLAGLPAFALRSAACCEFLLGEFMLNEPKVQLALMIPISDGEIGVGSRTAVVVAEKPLLARAAIPDFIPELDSEP